MLPSPLNYPRHVGTASVFLSLALTVGCGLAGPQSGPADPPPNQNWQPILSQQQVQTVRQFFPDFQPETFTSGASPTSQSVLSPLNFTPAQFFGPGSTESSLTSPMGISVQTNGFDSSQLPDPLPRQATYFDRSGVAHQIALNVVERSPLNILQERMGAPLTPDAPVISIDFQQGRVSLADIDNEMYFVRDELAKALPETASVSPTNAQIKIEPSIFYVTGSDLGDAWAGGETEPLSAGRYLIRLDDFYITFDPEGNTVLVNWKDYLVDEAINFYVMSIGRSDLAR